jgi:hypothetical protein
MIQPGAPVSRKHCVTGTKFVAAQLPAEYAHA